MNKIIDARGGRGRSEGTVTAGSMSWGGGGGGGGGVIVRRVGSGQLSLDGYLYPIGLESRIPNLDLVCSS
jgi:hypothetical protein